MKILVGNKILKTRFMTNAGWQPIERHPRPMRKRDPEQFSMKRL